MSTEITTKNASKDIVVTDDLLRNFLFTNNANITEREQASFFQIAKAFNLNPFKREIYCVAYGEGDKRQLSIITGYEVYIKRAERTGLLDGWKVEFFGKFYKESVNKEFFKRDGTSYFKKVEQIIEEERCFARITIHRKDRNFPFEHEVELAEYNQNNPMWTSKPVTMIKKVAIGQGFRLCFSDELAGMPYLAEEIRHDEEPRTPEYSVQHPQEATTQQATEAIKNAQNSSNKQKAEASEKDRPDFVGYIQSAGAKLGTFEPIIEIINSFGYDAPESVNPADFRPIVNEIKKMIAI
jgi:phage recombination protein Bet